MRCINRTVLFYIAVFIIGLAYGSAWLGVYNPLYDDNVTRVVFSEQSRPFVYRVFMPLFARLVVFVFGIPPDVAVMVVVCLSVVALFASLKYLVSEFTTGDIETVTFAITVLSILLVSVYRKIYDPATIFFFVLSLAFIKKNKLSSYYILFPLATLNRETTFLLIIFFTVYFYKKIPVVNYLIGLLYQFAVYGIIKASLTIIFSANDGYMFLSNPAALLDAYRANIGQTAVLIIVSAFILWLVSYRWSEKPEFLRTAFIILFPLQIVLHFLFGVAFEIRVMAESFPIVLLLAYQGIQNIGAVSFLRINSTIRQ